MPRLLRLNGLEVLRILAGFGFTVSRIKGSHHRVTRIVDGQEQHITVPVHGKHPMSTGTLRKIYRELCQYVSEDKARPYFYG